MRDWTNGLFIEAFRLNASRPQQLRLVRGTWLLGMLVAVIWMTAGQFIRPNDGAIAISNADDVALNPQWVASSGPPSAGASPRDK